MKHSEQEYCLAGCFVCHKRLVNFQPRGNHPLAGVEFETKGHYGSTIFDPMSGQKLLINICDECLSRGLSEHRVIHQGQGRFSVHDSSTD